MIQTTCTKIKNVKNIAQLSFSKKILSQRIYREYIHLILKNKRNLRRTLKRNTTARDDKDDMYEIIKDLNLFLKDIVIENIQSGHVN